MLLLSLLLLLLLLLLLMLLLLLLACFKSCPCLLACCRGGMNIDSRDAGHLGPLILSFSLLALFSGSPLWPMTSGRLETGIPMASLLRRAGFEKHDHTERAKRASGKWQAVVESVGLWSLVSWSLLLRASPFLTL
jgi:hypothetical protein